MTAEAPIDWPSINGDDFVRMVLDEAQLWAFIDLYQRNGFDHNDIRNLIWSKTRLRWRPSWETVESIADDQRKAAES